MTTHSFKMIAGLVIIAAIGALQAVHGTGGSNAASWIDTVVSILLIIEHSIAGDTTTVTPPTP